MSKSDSKTTEAGRLGWKSGVMALMLTIEGALVLAGLPQIAFGTALGAFAVLLAWIGSESNGR